tara:strand:- start:319 stop:1131 length:813 start_codon:yes stop_codon:yes gene_type:complete
MLKNRLIPVVILDNNNVVQSVEFKHTNVIGNAITAVDFFNSWAVDEIIILDVSRTKEKREDFFKIVEGLSKRCFVPLSIGGWIENNEDINNLLKIGADKVVINTEAIRNPDFIKNASKRFGSQCIVSSIDVRVNEENQYEVFINRGKENTGLDPVEWARKCEELGSGEIFLTSIEHEGMRNGYDVNLVKMITDAVDIPVIAFGGVGKWEHLVDGIKKGNANAVSAANIFHYTEHSTFHAKKFLVDAGLDVRKPDFYEVPTPRKPKYEEIF